MIILIENLYKKTHSILLLILLLGVLPWLGTSSQASTTVVESLNNLYTLNAFESIYIQVEGLSQNAQVSNITNPLTLETNDHLLSVLAMGSNNPIYSMISGIFYGMLIISVIAAINMYIINKLTKWLILLVTQGLMLTIFIYADIAKYTLEPAHHYALTYYENFIIITLVLYFTYLISYFYTFSMKKLAYNYQFKIHTAVSVLAICVLVYNSYAHQRLPLFVYIIVTLLVLVTQILMRYLKTKKRKGPIYVLLIINLIFLYTLSFTDLDIYDLKPHYQQTILILKIIAIALLLMNLVVNFLLIKSINTAKNKSQDQLIQYVSLVKNYHKLLLLEKKKQTGNTPNFSAIKEDTVELEKLLRDNYKLTDRELDVLNLIWEGYTNKAISQQLNITLSTTKYHIGNIYIKLNANSRSQIFALKG